MPFTLLSHQSVVLPLKMRRPALFSGTALVFGSMAPDFEYFLRFYAIGHIGHTLVGQFTFCLPLTLAVYWLVTRLVAVPLATNLPRAGVFRLRDYRLLAAQPAGARHWLIVAASALVGSFSHLALDAFTHSDGVVVTHVAWLRQPAAMIGANPLYRFTILQYLFTIVGAAITLWLLERIGRGAALRRWAAERRVAPPRRVARRPLAFWSALAPFPVAGVVASILFMQEGWLWTERGAWISTFLRTTTFTFAGLCVVSLWTRTWRTPNLTRIDGARVTDSESTARRRAFAGRAR